MAWEIPASKGIVGEKNIPKATVDPSRASCESLTGRWQAGIGVRVLVDDTVNEHLR